MSKVKEDSYIFCASIIRASENTLLPEAELVRAAEADTFQGAMAVLSMDLVTEKLWKDREIS